MKRWLTCASLLPLLLALPGCGQEQTSPAAGDGGAGEPPLGTGIPDGPAPPGCGNGERTADEACDDGNLRNGDGCSANCLGIEAGFSCFPAGQACRPIARCGDGVVAGSEPCDDGNLSEGDGCSAHCKLELGHQCEGAPSKCSTTTCGDKKQQGAEGCDDGNALPFDGCSAACTTEPDCAGGACTSKCGDGLVLNEACDDGNHKDGDGCSASCQLEPGFACTTESSCEKRDGKCITRVPVIWRDFDQSHPDFEVGCSTGTKGVVAGQLSATGKPVLSNGNNACIQSASTFNEWYTASANNTSIVGELTLYENGKGGFVNRYGPNGEQWAGRTTFTNVVYGGPAGGGCSMCNPSGTGRCYDPCTPQNSNGNSCCAEESKLLFDGNPLFFPIDNAPNARNDTRLRAKVPAEYGYDGWPWEDSVIPGAPNHDFHFTTEVVYWFSYEAGTSATLDFSGDDDVWVFVNGKLALDLGGVHVSESGVVEIGPASASRFGLSAGNVYEIRVFHAERKAEGSSFRLTLSGFNTSRSDCTPICGDGLVTAGEECDDGVNDGGYEQCAPGCVLGPNCGDGVLQEGEDCDDGNRTDGDGCGSSCRNLVLF